MQASIRLLRRLAEQEPPVLEPRRALESPLGHTWDEACRAFECDCGDEAALLDELAGGGFLEGIFRDRVLLCPFCRSAHLAFREICPTCRSADLREEDMIHHFRCGGVAPEKAYQRGPRLVCPKCDHPLRHIGVDYERPSRVLSCNACSWSGAESLTEARCFACGRTSEPDKVLPYDIRAYALTAHGALAAREGALVTAAGAGDGMIDPQYATLGHELLTTMYGHLADQARRYQRPLSVLAIHFDQYHDYARSRGIVQSSVVMKRVIELLKTLLRTCDLLAVANEHLVLAVLPETPIIGASVLARRLMTAFKDKTFEGGEVTVSVGVASMDECGGDEADSLLQQAAEAAEAATRQGGNRVVTCADVHPVAEG